MVVTMSLNSMATIADRIWTRIARVRQSSLGRLFLYFILAGSIIVAALPAALGAAFGTRPQYWVDLLWMWNKGYDHLFYSAFWLDQLFRLAVQAFILGVGAALVAGILFSAALLATWCLNVLLLRAFGAWHAWIPLVFESAVEPTPEGVQRFSNTGWTRDLKILARERTLFQHSEPYSSGPALAALEEWVRELGLHTAGRPFRDHSVPGKF
jgi:hypothetical protein